MLFSPSPFKNNHPIKRRAFSLVEILVAVAILGVLLLVGSIPLGIAGNMTSIGNSRATSQTVAERAIVQIKSDLQRAIYVYPNDVVPGITDAAPYNGRAPYFRNSSLARDVCPLAERAGNSSRIDMLMPRTAAGVLDPKLQSDNVLVSYYCRRRDAAKPYHPIENPLVLFRAQIPFRFLDTATNALVPYTVDAAGTANARLTESRFTLDCASNAARENRELRWMTMDKRGEFNLESLCTTPPLSNTAAPTFAAHSLVLARDTALIAPNAFYLNPNQNPAPIAPDSDSYVPDVAFLTSGSNGKITDVEIRLSVGQYDADFANRRDALSATGVPIPAVPRPQVARTLVEKVNCFNVDKSSTN